MWKMAREMTSVVYSVRDHYGAGYSIMVSSRVAKSLGTRGLEGRWYWKEGSSSSYLGPDLVNERICSSNSSPGAKLGGKMRILTCAHHCTPDLFAYSVIFKDLITLCFN